MEMRRKKLPLLDELKELENLKKELTGKIQESKKRKYTGLLNELDADIWGKGYKIIRRRLKNPRAHDKCTLSEEEVLNEISKLLLNHGDVIWSETKVNKAEIPEITVDEMRQAIKKT